jgi:hypothetical protein
MQPTAQYAAPLCNRCDNRSQYISTTKPASGNSQAAVNSNIKILPVVSDIIPSLIGCVRDPYANYQIDLAKNG